MNRKKAETAIDIDLFRDGLIVGITVRGEQIFVAIERSEDGAYSCDVLESKAALVRWKLSEPNKG